MASPLLGLPRAVAARPPDEGVADHYGDPYREQRALETAAGLVDRGNRGVLRISGPDRLSWLHDLTSQHLTGLGVGEATEALVLSPQGRVQHHLTLVDDGSAVWAHVEPGTAADLVGYLDSMRFMLRVEVADLSAEYAVLTLAGPSAAAALDTIGKPAGPVLDHEGDSAFLDLFAVREQVEEIAQALTGAVPSADPVSADPVSAGSVRPAGMWAYEALRIAAHRPRLGVDTDERTIPHEVGWIGSAVHLDKGCYRGQETVARVHNLGRPPRRLVMLHLDGSVDRLPERGSAVQAGDRRVGTVGSSARHYELGPIALALVKRSVPVDTELLADGIAAAQEVIVPSDTGANVSVDLRHATR